TGRAITLPWLLGLTHSGHRAARHLAVQRPPATASCATVRVEQQAGGAQRIVLTGTETVPRERCAAPLEQAPLILTFKSARASPAQHGARVFVQKRRRREP